MDFAGKTVIVTGSSDGIGRAAASAWAAARATVVMVGRNEAKTVAAARAIMSATGNRQVHWAIADLSRRDATLDLARDLATRHPRIHVLANNAGALFLDREDTADGVERTFALNHLAYMTLSLALLPNLAAAAMPGLPARVINVSSRAHRRASVNPSDWQLREGYRGWRAYANSKLYNLWFTRTLAARVDAARLVVHAMHPGVVRSRFATNNGAMGRVQRQIMNLVSVSPEQGADTLLWLSHAADAATSTGDYWVTRQRLSISRLARRDDLATQLWNASLPLTGLRAHEIDEYLALLAPAAPLST
jgi:retinol dehydrogenase-12